MGNKTSQKIKTGLDDQTQLIKQYTPSFERLRNNQNFFKQLITQNKQFVNNLFQLFPDALVKFEAFFEMVLFLRRQQAKFNINKYAIHNGPHTNLLDRFFMIMLKLNNEDYQVKVMNIQELDNLVINYFKLFLNEPEKGTISKILKFIQIQDEQVPLKLFVSTFREYFPHSQKYLKDFYLLKFKQLQKDAHILKEFKSKIVNNDAILIALKIPSMTNSQVYQLYNTQKYGLGFHSIQGKLVGYTGPWLLLIHHIDKNEKGEKTYHIFGSYQNGPIRNVSTYQGDVTGFMFSIHPTIKFFTTDKGQGGNHYFYINSIPQQKSKRRKGFGFGGNHDKKQFKLWIDQDLQRSTVFNGKDPTYGYGSLAAPSTSKLVIKRMEVWGLGSQHNVDDQVQYWKQRQEEIMRRRKVDKRQFVDQNASLFFQNTFGHRKDVVGQIQRQKKQQKH